MLFSSSCASAALCSPTFAAPALSCSSMGHCRAYFSIWALRQSFYTLCTMISITVFKNQKREARIHLLVPCGNAQQTLKDQFLQHFLAYLQQYLATNIVLILSVQVLGYLSLRFLPTLQSGEGEKKFICEQFLLQFHVSQICIPVKLNMFGFWILGGTKQAI